MPPMTSKPKVEPLQPQPQSTTFRDRHGREWDTELTLGSVRRIDASDFSLLTDKQVVLLRPDKTTFGELLTNVPLLCAVAWTVAKPQADKLSCPECDGEGADGCEACGGSGRFCELSFVDGLTAAAISDLRKAFWESLCRFFPDQKTALSICLRQYEAGLQAVNLQMAGMEDEIAEQIAAEVMEEIRDLPAMLRQRSEEFRRERSRASGESASA